MNDQPAILHWVWRKHPGDPVVLLCTSGTAASNYHPAITEAYYARIPLIVITADRPHELREVGAPQAIDQIRMYGKHVKYSVIFRWLKIILISMTLSIGMSAVHYRLRRQHPWGPVHLNVPFREPLLIDFDRETPDSTFNKRFEGADSFGCIHRATDYSSFFAMRKKVLSLQVNCRWIR